MSFAGLDLFTHAVCWVIHQTMIAPSMVLNLSPIQSRTMNVTVNGTSVGSDPSNLFTLKENLSTHQNITYVDFYLHKPPVAAVFTISYLLIFLVCMVGNGVVCFIVVRSKNMRTVTNLFILNLAISDLLVGIFCMPTTLVDNIITGENMSPLAIKQSAFPVLLFSNSFLTGWPFGSLVCKISGMVQGISVSASVFTLVAIAVDRRVELFTIYKKMTPKCLECPLVMGSSITN